MRGLIDRALAWVSDHAWKGYGTSVDLSSYTSSTNYYTAPSDGIVRLRANASSNNYFLQCRVANSDGSNDTLFSAVSNTSASGVICVPIFKGQRAWITARTSAAQTEFMFIPYKNYGGGSCLTLLSLLRGWQHERLNRSGAVIPLGSDRLRDENAGDKCDCIRRSNGRSIYTPDKKRLQNRSCHTDRDGRILRLLLSVNHDAERQADTDILPQYAYQRTSKQLLCLYDVYQGVVTPERGCAA